VLFFFVWIVDDEHPLAKRSGRWERSDRVPLGYSIPIIRSMVKLSVEKRAVFSDFPCNLWIFSQKNP